MNSSDPYQILKVHPRAKIDEIKKAYRKLAIKWHPDKNQGDSKAEEQFKKISEAFEILSDTQKKQKYDQFGHAAFEQGSSQRTGGFHSDPFDMFNSFFGGGGGGSGGGDGGDDSGDLTVVMTVVMTYNVC